MNFTLSTQNSDDYIKSSDKSQIICLIINYFHDELIEKFRSKQFDNCLTQYLAILNFIVQSPDYKNDTQLLFTYQHKVALIHLLVNTSKFIKNEDATCLWDLKNLVLLDQCVQCLQFHIDIQLFQESVRKIMAYFLISNKINDENLKKQYQDFLEEELYDYSIYESFDLDVFHHSLMESINKLALKKTNFDYIFKLLGILNSKLFDNRQDNTLLMGKIDKFIQSLSHSSQEQVDIASNEKIFVDKSQNTSPLKVKILSSQIPSGINDEELCFDLNYKNNLFQSTQKIVHTDKFSPGSDLSNLPDLSFTIGDNQQIQSSPPIEPLIASNRSLPHNDIDENAISETSPKKSLAINRSIGENTTKSSMKLRISDSSSDEDDQSDQIPKKRSNNDNENKDSPMKLQKSTSDEPKENKENENVLRISDTDLSSVENFDFKPKKTRPKTRHETLKSKKLLESSAEDEEEDIDEVTDSDFVIKKDTKNSKATRKSSRNLSIKKEPKRESTGYPSNRKYWTDKETAWLVYGYDLYSNGKNYDCWSQIIKNLGDKFQPGRTNVNLKDRWRVIVKKTNEFARYQRLAEVLKQQYGASRSDNNHNNDNDDE